MKIIKIWFLLISLSFGFGLRAHAQSVGIKSDGTAPENSAMLEVSSSTKGFLIPRMTTTEMKEINSPVEGLTVFNISLNTICFFDGTNWLSGKEGKSCGEITYEGQVYTTVIIDTQCWMAHNLNVGTRINGSSEQTDNSTIEKYCYDNNDSNCDVYGGLYQWNEMMQYSTTEGAQGICPVGWHLPTDAEWTALTDYLGTSVAGGKLKESGTAHWSSPNTGATNSSGFTALPGGFRNTDGSFNYLSILGYWWSSSQYMASYAEGRGLSYNNALVYRSSYNNTYGFWVRCLKND